MPLSQVIANDRAYKLKQDSQREEQKDVSDFVAFLLPFGTKRQNKELSSSNSSLSSTSETPNESTSPNTPEPAPRARRRVSRPVRVWCVPVGPKGLAREGKNPVLSVECGIFPLSCSNSDFFFRWKPALSIPENSSCSGNLSLVLVGKNHMDCASLLQITK